MTDALLDQELNLGSSGPAHFGTEPLTQEQLVAHAQLLARAHLSQSRPGRGRPLLPRLDTSERRLDEAYRQFSAASGELPQVPSEDWLRDNYHVVRDQIREIRQDLPRQYYLQLPKLVAGAFEGLPRIYIIASELVRHSAGRFDLDVLSEFVSAYQGEATLSIGETWAIPIMVRLALVEELGRLVDSVLVSRNARERARTWVSGARDGQPDTSDITALIDTEIKRSGRLPNALVVEVLQWLRDQPSSVAPAWQALEQHVQAQGETLDEMLRVEHHREAAEQLAIGNVITSMRMLSAIDWTLFFERVSIVERTLRDDPAGAYADMDFQTRDRYRHSIEQLAKRARAPELAVATTVVDLARHAKAERPASDREHHVGYYLISRGRFQLERALGYRPTWREHGARVIFKRPTVGYLGMLSVVTLAGVASMAAYASRHGASIGEQLLASLVCLIPISELAIGVVNLIVSRQIPPRPLPKLAMRSGIPESCRTMVVVPAIFDSIARIRTLFDDLEVRFLANRDPHLHFALLGDFADAAAQVGAEDDALTDEACRLVNALNSRYGHDRFFLFLRERRWNAEENRWMGWERKRGKLSEFNELLRDAAATSFVIREGDQSILPGIKYVITLDADTQLPIDEGRRLVGAIAHPLNQARFNPDTQRVTAGYGVLQPRVAINAARTPFGYLYSGHVGIDPYTTAVSDLYQDLFHEGSYVGKGIYDVDAFHAALEDRVPDNTLLSHDLFEGFFARVGLCTDIQVVDDYPTNYLAYSSRQHRWARGDWQIARWLWTTVPNAEGQSVPNTLPVIDRWKILDNLRRSLLAPALLLLLAGSWTFLPGSPLAWMLLALLVLAFPAYMQAVLSLSNRVRGVPVREHLRNERHRLSMAAAQVSLSVTFLAHQAYVMLDAIARTGFRLLVSRRHLLEWVTADAASRSTRDLTAIGQEMWAAPVIAVGLLVLVGAHDAGRLWIAFPVAVMWLLSPVVAYLTARPYEAQERALSIDDRERLRDIARKIWRFFEDVVTVADHWLIPDNYQEDRPDVLAHRTSPTNIGLQFLSTVAAADFGYLGIPAAVEHLERTIGTLGQLQRYRGHFYNWYDTRSLLPLSPPYVSTVDSGNLAGYLVTLKMAVLELVEKPFVDLACLDAVADAVRLAEQAVEPLGRSFGRGRDDLFKLRRDLAALRTELKGLRRPTTVSGWHRLLAHVGERLTLVAAGVHDSEEARATSESDVHALGEAHEWIERAATALADRQKTLTQFAPWLETVQTTHSQLPDRVLTLPALVGWCDQRLSEPRSGKPDQATISWVEATRQQAVDLIARAQRIAKTADDLLKEMDFTFLFDQQRQLFAIGYNVPEGRLDASYYDTLASEARLASFLAIAFGQITPEHWFRLGRSLCPVAGSRALLSWSASMFEYLMPLLVMNAYRETLLDETYTAVIARQIQYGADRGVPWGISESAYNVQDLGRNYQYRAFGVPGLGLKRGLADDLVIAPYATLLATPLRPHEAIRNLARLSAAGLEDRYGFYESIDYTPDRVPTGVTGGVVVRTYMAHHQGMSLLALDNCLNDDPMPRRFHADPHVQAADLLLQEKVPDLVPLTDLPVESVEHVPASRRLPVDSVRRYTTPHTLSPRAHFLSNGSYSVMITNAGGGYSRWRQLAVTRWREDITNDGWGTFCYVRNLATGDVWSTTHQPTGREPLEFEVTFALDRAVFRRRDFDLEIYTELTVSTEDDVEVRRVSLRNHGAKAYDLDLTSYAEVVLGPDGADLAHPAFSKLFVETSVTADGEAIICSRRPRGDEPRVYMFHVLGGRSRASSPTSYETDRAQFIGRGGTLRQPAALAAAGKLSKTTGAVLDPIVSLRQKIRVPPGETVRLTFATGIAPTEERAQQLIEKYRDRRAVSRTMALASTHANIELRHLGLTIAETMRFQRLGGRLLFGDSRLRNAAAIARNQLPVQGLWTLGISGDLPILVARVGAADELAICRELLQAHEYLRLKGFAFDLVLLNEHADGYRQELHDELQRLVESGPEQGWIDRPGGVFLRKIDALSADEQTMLMAAAQGVIEGSLGSLYEQLKRPQVPFAPVPPLVENEETEPTPPPFLEGLQRRLPWLPVGHAPAEPRRPRPPAPPLPQAPAAAAGSIERSDLEYFNGLGGYADGGREYVMVVDPAAGRTSPAPWGNVIANEQFGTMVTESGLGCTWSGNSHNNRLTPWNNDPVVDPSGEVLFLRDEESGAFWSATPLPAGASVPYTVAHGHGYSRFEHTRDGLDSELSTFVPAADPLKIVRLRIHNSSARPRRVSATMYVEWVLGENRTRTSSQIVTRQDPVTGAVLARNAFRQPYGERTAFLHMSTAQADDQSFGGDRGEFIGRNGTLASPAALGRESLSGRTGAGLDACGAFQLKFRLAAGETREVVVLVGEETGDERCRLLIDRYRSIETVDAAFAQTRAAWNTTLDTLVVSTPDRSFDLLVNRWLLYQTLVCRVWARTGFYQSSGAFGFRDQLQDVLALLFARPDLARAHILHAASRQFLEGDVQHWWHEPEGEGIRTKCSDDRLWLVYAVLAYVRATGDEAVLDEQVAFLEGRALSPAEMEIYERPTRSEQHATLYEHCVRAIEISLGTGAHGLPLIGTCDWNDGMNLVGPQGHGESVWLGWFLIAVLRPFADVAKMRGERARGLTYRRRADQLASALEQAWDGEWYRRAYFDDGTPLGSRSNAECQIDAIAQSWAAISGAGEPGRTRQALESSLERLMDRESGLLKLLAPPFDHSTPNPGYIQGYLAGIRENGGQYTHGALWTILALTELGDGDRAMDLFSLLNPIHHTGDRKNLERYKTEPYVVAGDVYSVAPHAGRGGWTWYTGSSGWMYRIAVENILGLTLIRNTLLIEPCIPRSWPKFEATLTRAGARLNIVVENPDGVQTGVVRVEVDGQEHHGPIPLDAGSRSRSIRVIMGAATGDAPVATPPSPVT